MWVFCSSGFGAAGTEMGWKPAFCRGLFWWIWCCQNSKGRLKSRMKPRFFFLFLIKYNIYSRLFCSGENRGYGFVSDFLHLPKGSTDLQKTHFPAYTPKITGTSEQACKSLILNRKTCSVTRTITEQPEQKTELSTGWASFTQKLNDRASSPAKKLNDAVKLRAIASEKIKWWVQVGVNRYLTRLPTRARGQRTGFSGAQKSLTRQLTGKA